ncbi:MAG: hypothetical protein ACR2KP_08435 [Egibacteraceae bacterium]
MFISWLSTGAPPRARASARSSAALQAVADVIGTTATRLSTLERELVFDTNLARRAHLYIST